VSYADDWRDAINETYTNASEGWTEDTILTALRKAGDCLRGGEEVTLSPEELDIIRHMMPAHECHQSATAYFPHVRWGVCRLGLHR
jgi:hypothetical protein